MDDGRKLSEFLDTLTFENIPVDLSQYTTAQLHDYKLIREYPVYRFDEFQYAILNFNFFLDKLFHGLFFDFKNILSSLPDTTYREITSSFFNATQQKCFNPFKTYFSSTFSEKVIFFKTIENVVRDKKAIHIPDDRINGLTDYYIRLHDKILLIEFKDVTMNAEAKHSYNYETLKNDIKEKFCNEKGIPQLVRAIEVLISRENLNFEGANSTRQHKQIKIYPIIIFTDPVFNFTGIDRILNEEFRSQLNNSTKVGPKSFKKINDLVIADVDFLLSLESNFKSGDISFLELLDNYLDILKKHKKGNVKFTDQNKFLRTLDNFSQISMTYLVEKNIQRDVPIHFNQELKNIITFKVEE